jgi:hypothetical protein
LGALENETLDSTKNIKGEFRRKVPEIFLGHADVDETEREEMGFDERERERERLCGLRLES